MLQILQCVRHGHATLAEKFFELSELNPRETGGTGNRELPFAIQRDSEFQMKLSLRFLPARLQAHGEVIRYVEGHTHGR